MGVLKMIPPHTCTPFCTGQRYCVEPGTHTIAVAWDSGKSLDDWRMDFPAAWELEVLRAVECPDLPKEQTYEGAERPLRETDVGWLVTVKES